MAIYSYFGNAVNILGSRDDERGPWVKIRFIESGNEREVHISELWADGGQKEVMEAIEAAKTLPQFTCPNCEGHECKDLVVRGFDDERGCYYEYTYQRCTRCNWNNHDFMHGLEFGEQS